MALDLRELLRPFKQMEHFADLAAVVDDPPSIRFLSAWPRAVVEWRPGKAAKPPTGSVERWRWIWKFVWLDVHQLGVATRLPRTTLDLVLRCAVEGRLVYPDRTLHRHAQELVNEFTINRMPGKKRGRPKKG